MIYRDDFTAIIESLRPRKLLAVTPHADDLLAKTKKRLPEIDYISISGPISEPIRGDDIAGRIEVAGQHDLALVADTLEYLPKEQALRVLALLRDVYAKVLYVVAPLGDKRPGLISRWEHTEFIAHGLRLVKSYEVADKPLNLYHYDIYDYKTTPDWLSSRHWANPELWDKYRW